MDINTFIKKYIENKENYTLSEDDKKVIQHQGINQLIFNKLNSTKYKASSIGKEYEQKIKDKIDLCIMHQIPIHITLPFGATKNPYLNTAPNIDWAEVFNISFIRDYLKPIAELYEYGVILDYVSVGIFEEKVNRIPQKHVDQYDNQFSDLIKFYKKYLPKNFSLNYKRVSDLISKKEIEQLLDKKIDQLRKTWRYQDKKTVEQKLFRARRNCLFDPKDKGANKIILNAALGHDAFCTECWTTKPGIWDEKDMIALGHNYTSGWAIHLRSTPASSVNFWSGTGLLMKKGDKYTPTVLSFQQYEAMKDSLEKQEVKLLTSVLPHLKEIQIQTI